MLTQTTALAPDGQPWQQVTLRNKSGMTVTVADWGATLLSARVTLADGSELSCNALRQEEVAKSTMTHHWRVLRDSGVIWQRPQGRENMISLRREDLDARFPGLLDTLLKIGRAHV